MISLELEKKFFHVILENREYLNRVHASFFENRDIGLLYKYATKFMEKYSDDIPTKDQLLYMIKKSGREDILTTPKVEIIWEAKYKEYDKSWYKKTMEGWIRYKSMVRGITQAGEFMRSKEIDEENAQSMCDSAMKIVNQYGFISFHDSKGLDFFNAESHYYDESAVKKPTGFPHIDMVTEGGITPGELWVFAGLPNVGKSIWLCNIAKGFVEEGANVVYISLEMNSPKVMRRIGANMFNIPVGEYFETARDTQRMKEIIQKYKKQVGFMKDIGNLYVEKFPTSDLDVPTLQSFLIENIEKVNGFKIDVVVIDYINIMKNWRNPNSENTYLTIKQISEDLRGMGDRNNWSIITATQFNRNANDKNSGSIGMGNIAESSGLSHTMDVSFGIIQEGMMKSEGLFDLKVMKNRDGGYKDVIKKYNINYNYMKLTEHSEEYRTEDTNF